MSLAAARVPVRVQTKKSVPIKFPISDSVRPSEVRILVRSDKGGCTINKVVSAIKVVVGIKLVEAGHVFDTGKEDAAGQMVVVSHGKVNAVGWGATFP